MNRTALWRDPSTQYWDIGAAAKVVLSAGWRHISVTLIDPFSSDDKVGDIPTRLEKLHSGRNVSLQTEGISAWRQRGQSHLLLNSCALDYCVNKIRWNITQNLGFTVGPANADFTHLVACS